MAGVLTVASTSDWNVSTGGNWASRPSAPRRARRCCKIVGDDEGLLPGVRRKRVVLERVVFGNDVEPARLLEVGNRTERADDTARGAPSG